MDSLIVNQQFSTIDELNDAVKAFEDYNFVKLYRKDTRTVTSFKKRCPNRPIKEELGYSNLLYCCIHGGKKFKSRSTGKQVNTK